MVVAFARIIDYLEAIAAKGNDPEDAPHGVFWRVDRDSLIAMNVPNVTCVQGTQRSPIRVIVPGDPNNSPLLSILSADRAVCNKRQMPDGGPFVTDVGYSVTLKDGSNITGKQILDDLRDWIKAGCPQ